ncbi:MAG: AraC family transcriptional regulator, partial [Spirochaetia bacterium]|nr:AraC family transcriptional regulator [Spirochaetia bacterium]
GAGFRQVQHFNRVFKKMVGLSPRGYQKNPGSVKSFR